MQAVCAADGVMNTSWRSSKKRAALALAKAARPALFEVTCTSGRSSAENPWNAQANCAYVLLGGAVQGALQCA